MAIFTLMHLNLINTHGIYSQMRINQIRPEDLNTLAEHAYMQDVRFYRSKREEFIERSCPACELENNSTFLFKHEFEYSRCKGCQSIYMNPAPTQDLVNQLYKQSENYKFWSEEIYPKSREERLKTIHKERAEWVLNCLYNRFPNQEQFTLLELGAGTGDTLVTIKNRSKVYVNISATEPNPSMAQHLESNGISIVAPTELNSNTYINKFDAIVSFEVLEHLLYPANMLMQMASNLKLGGLFFASTPNSQSLEVQLLKEESTTVDIEHISILAPPSVHAMASRSGYKVLDISTPGEFDLELMKRARVVLSVLNKNKRMSSQEIQEFIKISGFASHMKIVLERD